MKKVVLAVSKMTVAKGDYVVVHFDREKFKDAEILTLGRVLSEQFKLRTSAVVLLPIGVTLDQLDNNTLWKIGLKRK